MTCPHPNEERQRVYEGQARPRIDRMLCGLCGELLYLAAHLAQLEAVSGGPAPATGLDGALLPVGPHLSGAPAR